jgi:hypothetical protein
LTTGTTSSSATGTTVPPASGKVVVETGTDVPRTVPEESATAMGEDQGLESAEKKDVDSGYLPFYPSTAIAGIEVHQEVQYQQVMGSYPTK